MPFLQYLTWSPHEDAYAYVYHCNIYYKPAVQSSKVYPITSDGTDQTTLGPIYNGIPDWVYEGNNVGCFIKHMNSKVINCTDKTFLTLKFQGREKFYFLLH